MSALMAKYRGLSFIIDVNWDRLFYALTLVFALSFGAWVGSMSLP